jgi:hypothetical protein
VLTIDSIEREFRPLDEFEPTSSTPIGRHPEKSMCGNSSGPGVQAHGHHPLICVKDLFRCGGLLALARQDKSAANYLEQMQIQVTLSPDRQSLPDALLINSVPQIVRSTPNFSGAYMLKATAAILFAAVFLNQDDQFLAEGKYTEGLFLVAHAVVRSFVG